MDLLEAPLNEIRFEASQILVKFLPGWVRDHLCNILDPEAIISVGDYRGLGELLGLTTVQVRSIRANNNGRSVTDAILQLFDSTLSVWDLIFYLRQMRVGAVREILQAWPEIRWRYYQSRESQMRFRSGMQNMEGECWCPNCRPPGGSTCSPSQQTSHPGCSCYQHNQAMNWCPQPRQTLLKRGQDGVSYDLHNQAYRNQDRNQRMEHDHSGHTAQDTLTWGQTLHGHVAEGTADSYGKHPYCSHNAAVLQRNPSNEDNCSYFGPNLVHRVLGERQGTGGMCQEESKGEAGQQGERQDSQQGEGRDSQQGLGWESQQTIGRAGQERIERAGQERQENIENRLHQRDVMENFLSPDDLTSLSGGQDLSQQASFLPVSPFAQGYTGNSSSEMAHFQNNNHNRSPVPDNNRHIHLHFPEHQRDQGFPEIRDNFDQTVRKMACSTSEHGPTLHDGQQGLHASLPQTQTNIRPAAPVQHVIEPCVSEGVKQQSYQSQIANPELNQVSDKEEVSVVKMRDSSRSLDTQEAREKRNSDPTSSTSSSHSDPEDATQPPGAYRQRGADQQTGYGASNGSGTLRRQKSDEIVYQRPSVVINVTTPESELGKFVFITGGEHQQSNQVEKEIWRLCKKLYGEGITVVADLPRGIVTMPLDPLAVRRNMRHNINEAVHRYFQKATCVILAVSPGYHDYVDSRSNPVSPSSHHNSVRFIYTNMMNEYCQKNFCRNKRFYPVMLSKVGGRKEHIPDWLTSTLTYTFPANNSELFRHLKDDLK